MSCRARVTLTVRPDRNEVLLSWGKPQDPKWQREALLLVEPLGVLDATAIHPMRIVGFITGMRFFSTSVGLETDELVDRGLAGAVCDLLKIENLTDVAVFPAAHIFRDPE